MSQTKFPMFRTSALEWAEGDAATARKAMVPNFMRSTPLSVGIETKGFLSKSEWSSAQNHAMRYDLSRPDFGQARLREKPKRTSLAIRQKQSIISPYEGWLQPYSSELYYKIIGYRIWAVRLKRFNVSRWITNVYKNFAQVANVVRLALFCGTLN